MIYILKPLFSAPSKRGLKERIREEVLLESVVVSQLRLGFWMKGLRPRKQLLSSLVLRLLLVVSWWVSAGSVAWRCQEGREAWEPYKGRTRNCRNLKKQHNQK